jgi:hypothetical protein
MLLLFGCHPEEGALCLTKDLILLGGVAQGVAGRQTKKGDPSVAAKDAASSG